MKCDWSAAETGRKLFSSANVIQKSYRLNQGNKLRRQQDWKKTNKQNKTINITLQ